jgi:AmmeMemoRadiSam system protein B
MSERREAAVAGTFYSADAAELAASIDEMLATAARAEPSVDRPPKALVVPHAGHVYSGPVAALAYATLLPVRDQITRVVLLGPAHHAGFDGLALPRVDAFRTPLGDIPIDDAVRGLLAGLPGVVVDDRPHAPEHSLEVQLPFLQRLLPAFTLVPIVVGHAPAATVARVLDAAWGGPETLVLISSDLSHYETYESAAAHDAETARSIATCASDAIGPYDACGAYPLRGLLELARARDLAPTLLDLRSSGDTAGPRDRVVGYGAFALVGSPAGTPS